MKLLQLYGRQFLLFSSKFLSTKPIIDKNQLANEFPNLRQLLLSHCARLCPNLDKSALRSYILQMLNYNIGGGKLNRSLLFLNCYKALLDKDEPKETFISWQQAVTVAWSIELMQSSFLIADDIMDGSETRRMKKCWYKVENVGLAAVNDALFLNSMINLLLMDNLSLHPKLCRIIAEFDEAKVITSMGQSLDQLMCKQPLELSNDGAYWTLVTRKTSHYSFYLPIIVAYLLANIDDFNLFSHLKELTYRMGHLFQAQDDFLDCFGDEKLTGKVGTDIQDGKCTWLLVKALEVCHNNANYRNILEKHYGRVNTDCVATIKRLYEELQLREQFQQFERFEFTALQSVIVDIQFKPIHQILQYLANSLYKRSS